MDEFHRRQMVNTLISLIQQATGRRYSISFDLLDDDSLREVQRFLRDIETEKQRAVQQARLWPWRR
ncbi:MAG: hypothetical protein HY905_00355 [Deltaproteobacteria bacterium]|nr:hypothetical protein [Deltaproteobacteria bacterium]